LLTKYTESDFKEGQVLLIDKPLEWTSFDVVNKIRYAIRKTFGIRKIKVGHAGTLDPLATGLLIICTGKATKQINEFMGQPKEYTGTIQLGSTTPSYDLETEPDHTFPTEHITPELVEEVIRKQFTGDIMQTPPVFSAIKKEGQKAYELARQGIQMKMEKRPVQITSFETELKEDVIHFRVECSKGTYIRSLAHDLGQALQSGGHLSALRRTSIGTYSVEDALDPLQFAAQLNQE